jgi:hypothetical protein
VYAVEKFKLSIMKHHLLLICLFSAFLGSCRKDNVNPTPAQDDYIIFGHFFGECAGEGCIEMFKLTQTQVAEDISDQYWLSGGNQPGNFTVLSEDKFEAVKDLMTQIPADLYAEASVIGIPDGGDWGGLYLEQKKDGETRKWSIDMMKSNVPEKYHAFIDLLNARIKLLQD